MIPKYAVLRRLSALLALPALLLAGCESSTVEPAVSETEAAVVVSSTDRSLTVIPSDGTAPYTIGIGPEGSPVSVAARGNVAVVPLGTYPFAAVVDLRTRSVRSTVPLPAGSGATGAAFLNDSIALVANPNLNSVTPINVLRGTTGAPIPVGVYPQEIVAMNGRAYVLNANLNNFRPAGPGSISVIDQSLAVTNTIALGADALNPGSAAFGPGGLLVVVNSGSYNANNGTVSLVDVNAGRELVNVPGFGNFPGSVAVGPDGRVYVGVYGEGILVFDAATQRVVRGLDDPLRPGGVPPVSDLAVDSEGRLHALNPGSCKEPGTALRLTAAGEVERQTATGICPFGIVLTRIQGL